MSRGCPLDRWTGQDSGTSLVSEGGISNGRPMDVHWTGRTILSGQRILMANLDMSGFFVNEVDQSIIQVLLTTLPAS